MEIYKVERKRSSLIPSARGLHCEETGIYPFRLFSLYREICGWDSGLMNAHLYPSPSNRCKPSSQLSGTLPPETSPPLSPSLHPHCSILLYLFPMLLLLSKHPASLWGQSSSESLVICLCPSTAEWGPCSGSADRGGRGKKPSSSLDSG